MSDFESYAHEDESEPKLDTVQEAADWKWLMADRRGRRVVRRLLSRSGVFRSSFNGDPNATIFNEGSRNLGLAMLALVQAHAPEQLALVLTETGKHD